MKIKMTSPKNTAFLFLIKKYEDLEGFEGWQQKKREV